MKIDTDAAAAGAAAATAAASAAASAACIQSRTSTGARSAPLELRNAYMQHKQQQKQQQLQQQPQQLQGHFGNFFEKVWPHVAWPHLAFSECLLDKVDDICLPCKILENGGARMILHFC